MTENFEIDIKNFFINLPKNSSYFDILVSSPSPVQKRTLGKIIIATKIDSKVQTKNLANIINENIRSNYYSNINANVEFAIESTLIDFNKKIKEIEKIEKIKDFEKSFSSMVIIVKGNDIYFTQHGKMKSLLMHKDKIIDINDENKIESNNTFSDIVIGKIYKHTTLFFASDNLFDYIATDKISNHIENSNIENTDEFIQKSLDAKNEIEESLGYIIIGENKNIEEQVEIFSEEVIIEDKKEELISKIAPKINIGLSFLSAMKEQIKKISLKISQDEKIKKVFASIKLNIAVGLNKLKIALKNSINKNKIEVSKTIRHLPSKTIDKIKVIQGEIKNKSLKTTLSETIEKIKKWFNELDSKKKIVFISLVSLIVVSIFCFRIYQNNRAIELEKNEYQSKVDEIKSLHNEASSVLMYGNITKAKNLIAEAEYAINNLKTDSKTRKDNKNILLEENKNVLNKIFKITEITNPTILNDLNSLNQVESNPDITSDISITKIDRILSIKEKMFAIDYQNKNIYEFDKNNIKKINIDNKDIGTFTACNNSTTENGNIVIFDSNSSMFVFDGEKLTKIDTGEKLKNVVVSDISSYASNIYLIDKTNKKMYTSKKVNNKYGTLVSWLKDPFEFDKFSSISIDGYIYLSGNDGIIKKYLKGYNKAFTLDTIEPTVSNINKIYTNENDDYVYILDKKENRVVIFNKNTGILVNQFKSTSFNSLEDFIVNKVTNKIYLLNNNKVFEITI